MFTLGMKVENLNNNQVGTIAKIRTYQNERHFLVLWGGSVPHWYKEEEANKILGIA